MLGRKERWQEDLFVAGPLCDLIPDDHILKRVDRVLDLSWLRAEVRDLYCPDNGRPGIDPEAAVRLMLAGLFGNITRDRHLLREAQVNLAIRWFVGYRLHERLPDQQLADALFRLFRDSHLFLNAIRIGYAVCDAESRANRRARSGPPYHAARQQPPGCLLHQR